MSSGGADLPRPRSGVGHACDPGRSPSRRRSSPQYTLPVHGGISLRSRPGCPPRGCPAGAGASPGGPARAPASRPGSPTPWPPRAGSCARARPGSPSSGWPASPSSCRCSTWKSGTASIPLSAGKELRPFTDLLFLIEPDPVRSGEAFAAEVAAVIPRPLPEDDALLRAHLRWLASCRRSRTRGAPAAQRARPARAGAGRDASRPWPRRSAEVVAAGAHEPTVLVMGDAELVRAAGGQAGRVGPRRGGGRPGGGRRHWSTGCARRGTAPRARPWWWSTPSPTPERLAGALYGGRARLPHAGADRRAWGGWWPASPCAAAPSCAGGGWSRRWPASAPSSGPPTAEPPTQAARDLHARLIADATSTSPPFVPSGHEVLVVDDEAVVLTVLREALRRGGYRVTTAASGEEAIDLMQRRTFDLVLTDKNLPGASGLEVARVARALPSPARRHPDHRLFLLRFGGRGAGHRRLRLHRKADRRSREPALPRAAGAVPPRRAAVARAGPPPTSARAGSCWSRSRGAGAS